MCSRSRPLNASTLGRLLGRTGGLLGLLVDRLADRGGGAKHAVGELALGVQELGGEVEHRVDDLGRGGQLVQAIIIVGRLFRQAWACYRWEARPKPPP
jgi:hypothetical protein